VVFVVFVVVGIWGCCLWFVFWYFPGFRVVVVVVLCSVGFAVDRLVLSLFLGGLLWDLGCGVGVQGLGCSRSEFWGEGWLKFRFWEGRFLGLRGVVGCGRLFGV